MQPHARKKPLPPPSAANRTRRRAAEVIDAAAQVFAEHGYHGATTQDIADVLGIRQASLYYYVSSKEAALAQVCMLGVGGYVERARAIAAGRGPASEKITALLRNHLAPLEDRPAFVRVFLRERHHLAHAGRRRVGRLARRYERIVQQVFDAGVRTGELRADVDGRLAALALIGMGNAATAWYGIEPNASLERIVAEFGRLISIGTLATRGGARMRRRLAA